MKGQELARLANYSHLTEDYLVIRVPCDILRPETQLAYKRTLYCHYSNSNAWVCHTLW